MHPVFYLNYLCPHLRPASPLPPALLPLEVGATGECKAEAILDSCIGYSGTESLIKWLSYLVFESTWELASHLANNLNIPN